MAKNKTELTPKDILIVLSEVGAVVNNNALSTYFSKKGVVISANSIRAIKSHITRNA
jgi:hypothetical protein